MKATLGIEGMSCGHCQKRVSAALSGVPGVKSAVVDLAKKNAEVESDSYVDEESLKKAVADAGYKVSSITKS
jgi:copper chaperone CopZ